MRDGHRGYTHQIHNMTTRTLHSVLDLSERSWASCRSSSRRLAPPFTLAALRPVAISERRCRDPSGSVIITCVITLHPHFVWSVRLGQNPTEPATPQRTDRPIVSSQCRNAIPLTEPVRPPQYYVLRLFPLSYTRTSKRQVFIWWFADSICLWRMSTCGQKTQRKCLWFGSCVSNKDYIFYCQY